MSIMRDGYVEKGIYPSRIPHDLALSLTIFGFIPYNFAYIIKKCIVSAPACLYLTTSWLEIIRWLYIVDSAEYSFWYII